MRKKKEKDYELEQDLFAISKANRRVMIVFLIIMLALWCVPIYSLLKDSLKVHGIANGMDKLDLKVKLDSEVQHTIKTENGKYSRSMVILEVQVLLLKCF